MAGRILLIVFKVVISLFIFVMLVVAVVGIQYLIKQMESQFGTDITMIGLTLFMVGVVYYFVFIAED